AALPANGVRARAARRSRRRRAPPRRPRRARVRAAARGARGRGAGPLRCRGDRGRVWARQGIPGVRRWAADRDHRAALEGGHRPPRRLARTRDRRLPPGYRGEGATRAGGLLVTRAATAPPATADTPTPQQREPVTTIFERSVA